MKITVINGCENKIELESEVMDKLCGYLQEKNTSYKINNLSEISIRDCSGCESCQNINPGICAVNDGVNDILKQYLSSDISIIVTPIKFGCYNSITKNFIDRTEPLFLPYQIVKKGRNIMKPRYKRYPDIVFLGIVDNIDMESIEVFKETCVGSNLSLASNEVKVKIITADTLNNIEELVSI